MIDKEAPTVKRTGKKWSRPAAKEGDVVPTMFTLPVMPNIGSSSAAKQASADLAKAMELLQKNNTVKNRARRRVLATLGRFITTNQDISGDDQLEVE